jgi:hypothetical protein
VYGQVIGGKLLLKVFLFAVPQMDNRVRQSRRSRSSDCALDHRHGTDLSRPTYSLPFVELVELARTFVGFWVQPTEGTLAENGREFKRIGCGMLTVGYGTRFLDDEEWGRLLGLRPPEMYGEEIVLI